ncbi:MAG: EscU/YscU/HrcU family type III secretion system export apparatus switch protein [Myxococcota bacterium]
MAEKTEQPTPRRLRQLRERGEVPVSGALSQAAGFAVGVALLPSAASAAFTTLSELLRVAAEGRALDARSVGPAVLSLSLPLLAGVAFASAAATFVQSGGSLAPQNLRPSFERLNLLKGFAALMSGPRLFALLRALIASAVLSLLAWSVLRSALPRLFAASGELGRSSAFSAASSLALTREMAAVALALGALDWLFTRRHFLQRHRMSRDEVRREHKESEGDPELKAARRRAHQEVLMSATVHAVRNASVLIVNPTHLATALRYDEEQDEAPRILAQGDGDLARRMIEAAHAYGVPVVQDIPLARALAELEAGEEIPEVLYEAVAEVLRTLWEAEQARRSSTP